MVCPCGWESNTYLMQHRHSSIASQIIHVVRHATPHLYSNHRCHSQPRRLRLLFFIIMTGLRGSICSIVLYTHPDYMPIALWCIFHTYLLVLALLVTFMIFTPLVFVWLKCEFLIDPRPQPWCIDSHLIHAAILVCVCCVPSCAITVQILRYCVRGIYAVLFVVSFRNNCVQLYTAFQGTLVCVYTPHCVVIST